MSPANGRLGGMLLLGLAAALGTQALAIYAGIAMALHLPALLAAPLAVALGTALLLAFPLAATLIGAVAAVLAWHWPMWLVLLTFCPFGVLNFLVGGAVGIARLAALLRRGHVLTGTTGGGARGTSPRSA